MRAQRRPRPAVFYSCRSFIRDVGGRGRQSSVSRLQLPLPRRLQLPLPRRLQLPLPRARLTRVAMVRYLLFYIKRPAEFVGVAQVLRERAAAALAVAAAAEAVAAEMQRLAQSRVRARCSSSSSGGRGGSSSGEDSDVPLLALKARRDGSRSGGT